MMLKEALEYLNRTNRKIEKLGDSHGVARYIDYEGSVIVDTVEAAHADGPIRASGARIVHTLTDLEALATDLGTSPRHYLDLNGEIITTVLDDDTSAAAGWRANRLSFQFVPSREYELVSGYLNVMHQQEEFIELIERITPFVRVPDPAIMLEISSSLQAVRNATIQNSVRNADGNMVMQWIEETEGKAGAAGDLEIPRSVAIQVPFFTHGEPSLIELHFRWRANRGAGITMGLYAPTLRIQRSQAVQASMTHFMEDSEVDSVWGMAPDAAHVVR